MYILRTFLTNNYENKGKRKLLKLRYDTCDESSIVSVLIARRGGGGCSPDAKDATSAQATDVRRRGGAPDKAETQRQGNWRRYPRAKFAKSKTIG